MRLLMGTLAFGILVVTGAARAQEATAPAAVTAPPPAATAPGASPAPAGSSAAAAMPAPPAPPGELKAPENIHAEPSTPASAELSSRAATAEMKGDPQDALKLADQGIRADAKDPWPYYEKGMALAREGETNGAVAALLAAEQHFAASDRWGRSVAIFGRAHTLAEAGRCDEARAAFQEYMSLVRGDPDAVALAARYSRDCRPLASSASPAAK
jgi:tetratricopeptide (TPR) repeat protein